MSNHSETTDPTRTGNVGPSFIQGSRTGSNMTPGPMEGEATPETAGDVSGDASGAAANSASAVGEMEAAARGDTIGNAGQPLDPDTAQAGGQGAAGLAAAASHDDVADPGTAAPRGLSGVAGVGNPSGAGGPGAGGAMGEGGDSDVTTLGEQ